MTEYKQLCPDGPCFLCADTGYLRGNGSAQTNPVKNQAPVEPNPITELATRRLEEMGKPL